jgi:23S rRNA pseudouridine2605 synthase
LEPRQKERLEKPISGPRKYISALRAEVGEERSGQRKRIERGETADRKGRKIAIERVVPAEKWPPKAEPASRNAVRFRAERQGREQRSEQGRDNEKPRTPPRKRAFAEGAPEARPDFGKSRRDGIKRAPGSKLQGEMGRSTGAERGGNQTRRRPDGKPSRPAGGRPRTKT